MSKHLAGRWLSLADRLSHLEPPFRAKNIAICLASAYRQGWSASRKEEVEENTSATILLRGAQEQLQACMELRRAAFMRIAALEAENAALKERWEKALIEAREAAGHEFGLWPLGAAAITHQLREDKARLVKALERICTHSRDADCGDHCSNACMYCQGRAAIDAARKGGA